MMLLPNAERRLERPAFVRHNGCRALRQFSFPNTGGAGVSTHTCDANIRLAPPVQYRVRPAGHSARAP